MDFISHTLVFILTGYLAFTNTLALHIEKVLDKENQRPIHRLHPYQTEITESSPDTLALTSIPSVYEKIPQILIDNSAYQGASVISAIGNNPKTATTSPLAALVNIFCRYEHDDKVQAITGTGFIISSNGVILTNAHIAQFLLLQGLRGNADCIARTGNPATPAYQLNLLYISPAWIIENAKLISTKNPAGTGERDYALLYITSGIKNAAVPADLPYLKFDINQLKIRNLNTPVTVAGYPAETAFSEGGADAPLIPKVAETTIAELMTFGGNNADVMTISGSVVGEQGSSGGSITNTDGQVIGIVSTRGDDTDFGQGSLRAITLSYIDRTIREETGFSLQQNTSGNLPFRAKLFTDTMVPILKLMLEQKLQNN